MNHIGEVEMKRLINMGARAALFDLIARNPWPKECLEVLRRELAKYKEADHELA